MSQLHSIRQRVRGPPALTLETARDPGTDQTQEQGLVKPAVQTIVSPFQYQRNPVGSTRNLYQRSTFSRPSVARSQLRNAKTYRAGGPQGIALAGLQGGGLDALTTFDVRRSKTQLPQRPKTARLVRPQESEKRFNERLPVRLRRMVSIWNGSLCQVKRQNPEVGTAAVQPAFPENDQKSSMRHQMMKYNIIKDLE